MTIYITVHKIIPGQCFKVWTQDQVYLAKGSTEIFLIKYPDQHLYHIGGEKQTV